VKKHFEVVRWQQRRQRARNHVTIRQVVKKQVKNMDYITLLKIARQIISLGRNLYEGINY